jgi:hypothetical protein
MVPMRGTTPTTCLRHLDIMTSYPTNLPMKKRSNPLDPTQRAPSPAALHTPAEQKAATVMGVPLLPGERVVYFHQHSYALEKVAIGLFVILVFGMLIGVLLHLELEPGPWLAIIGLPLFIGFFFPHAALTLSRRKAKAQVVTTLRIIAVPSRGEPISHWMRSISAVEAVRPSVGELGAQFGALVGLGIVFAILFTSPEIWRGLNETYAIVFFPSMILPIIASYHYANRAVRNSAKYWKPSVGVTLVEQGGERHTVFAKRAHHLGPLLADVLSTGLSCSSVQYPPRGPHRQREHRDRGMATRVVGARDQVAAKRHSGRAY